MMLSVCMITYGHEKFIQKAIEGVLMQKCDFEFELIISNDNSPDGSDQIIQDQIHQHPNHQVRYYTHSKNKGMMSNFVYTLEKCKGKYIAFCEGDDFWKDPLKLQRQVDFLQKNDEYTICFHPVDVVDTDGKKTFTSNTDTKAITGFMDLMKYNYIHTPSVVVRKSALPEVLPPWYRTLPICDWPLYLIAASSGKVKMLSKIMAAYRIHEDGIWSQKKKWETDYEWGKQILTIYPNFSSSYKGKFLSIAAKHFASLLQHNITTSKKHHYIESIRLYYSTFRYRPLKGLLSPVKWYLKRIIVGYD